MSSPVMSHACMLFHTHKKKELLKCRCQLTEAGAIVFLFLFGFFPLEEFPSFFFFSSRPFSVLVSFPRAMILTFIIKAMKRKKNKRKKNKTKKR